MVGGEFLFVDFFVWHASGNSKSMCPDERDGDGLKVIKLEFKEKFLSGFMDEIGGKIVARTESEEIGNEGHKILKCWFSNESGTGGEKIGLLLLL